MLRVRRVVPLLRYRSALQSARPLLSRLQRGLTSKEVATRPESSDAAGLESIAVTARNQGNDRQRRSRSGWRKVAAAGVVVGGVAAAVASSQIWTAMHSEEAAGASPDSLLDKLSMFAGGVSRAAAATVCGMLIIADYKWSLRGLKEDSDEYKRVRSEVHARSAQRMLKLARRNKGVFVKAGQHIASLRPAIPDEFTVTLSVLQDNAPARPFSDTLATVERELGKRLDQLFKEFDKEPVAAASLAQVHRAVTHDGETVAVKVQHPHLYSEVKGDLLTLEWMVKMVETFFPDYQFSWILPEFRENLLNELQFRREARNSEICAANFAREGFRRIYVPKVHWPMTTDRVLTMEFARGVKVNDKAGIAALGCDKRDAAETVARIFGDQIFVHGFVHSDPHPGNMLVRRMPKADQQATWLGLLGSWWRAVRRFFGGQVAEPSQVILLDHGLYRVLKEEFRLGYCEMWAALILQDEAKLRAACEQLGVGQYTQWFPLIFMHRTINTNAPLGHQMAPEERKALVAKLNLKDLKVSDISNFMEKLPRDMLFVLRTNNLVRGINFDLGGTSRDRFRVFASCCVRGRLHTHPGTSRIGAGRRRTHVHAQDPAFAASIVEPHLTSLWWREQLAVLEVLTRLWVFETAISARRVWKSWTSPAPQVYGQLFPDGLTKEQAHGHAPAASPASSSASASAPAPAASAPVAAPAASASAAPPSAGTGGGKTA